MAKVLIADACKASLVMSSEVFKDKIMGIAVAVAKNGAETLDMVKKEKPDVCVIDFDLPDVDGVTLIGEMRKVFKGPIFLTAYPDKIVEEAVNKHLFGFDDAGTWLPKPVNVDILNEKIDRYLVGGKRIIKRYDTALETTIIGKSAGRGKRSPKCVGNVINMSLDGACVRVKAQPGPMKVSQELVLSIPVKVASKGKEKPPVKAKIVGKAKARRAALTLKAKKPRFVETKIKAKVAWIKTDGHIGVQFHKMSDIQRKAVETVLRDVATQAVH